MASYHWTSCAWIGVVEHPLSMHCQKQSYRLHPRECSRHCAAYTRGGLGIYIQLHKSHGYEQTTTIAASNSNVYSGYLRSKHSLSQRVRLNFVVATTSCYNIIFIVIIGYSSYHSVMELDFLPLVETPPSLYIHKQLLHGVGSKDHCLGY